MMKRLGILTAALIALTADMNSARASLPPCWPNCEVPAASIKLVGHDGGDDLAQFLNAFFVGGSALGCNSKCP